MKTTQIRVSRNVKFFADRMMRKFDLVPFYDDSLPVVMYGIYNADDYEFFENYKSPVIALWRGTDARIINEGKAKIILSRNHVKHYAAGKIVYASLKQHGIESQILPITSTDPGIRCKPRGDWVYCFVHNNTKVRNERYRYGWLKYLQKKLPYKFAFTTIDQFDYSKLLEIYKKCFIGIRLLDHDGLSNSILEMGLMGRQTISNSGLPYTIKWKNLPDISDSIIRQYKTRHQNNKHISDAYRKLIDIGDKWLEV